MAQADHERPVPEPDARPGSDLTAQPAKQARAAPADLQSYIGEQLRAAFDDVAKQPVPDRFLDLMKRLG